MTTNIISAQQYGSLQFSLKSLMFVTMIVAVCAALVHVSVLLAVLFIPLIAAGLARTVRVVMRGIAAAEDHGVTPGMFVTLCQSIAILVAMIGVAVAAILFAAMTATLVALMIAIHVALAARVAYRPFTRRAWVVLSKLAERCRAAVSRIKPMAILQWVQLQAVTGMLSLLRACRRLYRQNWALQQPTAFLSAKSQASRTEPL